MIFEVTRNCFGIRYKKCEFNAVSLLAMSASLKWNIYQRNIIKQFGFEISKEMMDNYDQMSLISRLNSFYTDQILYISNGSCCVKR